MTSSGTYNYSLSIGEGVLAAYERVGVRSPSIRQEHMLTARREINLLFAQWANKQVNMWKTELISETLVDGQETYDVPSRVVMILDAYVSTNFGTTSQTDLYISPVSRTDYASYANKFTPGRPTSYWFDRLIAPTITLWPVPNADDTWTLSYYACTQMQDANIGSGETPDVPYLWLDAMVAGLAHRFARVYAPALEKQRKEDAIEAWTEAAAQNTENVPMSMTPGLGGYYR